MQWTITKKNYKAEFAIIEQWRNNVTTHLELVKAELNEIKCNQIKLGFSKSLEAQNLFQNRYKLQALRKYSPLKLLQLDNLDQQKIALKRQSKLLIQQLRARNYQTFSRCFSLYKLVSTGILTASV